MTDAPTCRPPPEFEGECKRGTRQLKECPAPQGSCSHPTICQSHGCAALEQRRNIARMNRPVADDFADIAARLAAIKRFDSCVEEPETVCAKCEGDGWECYGIGHHDPHFRVCDACGNPEDHPSP